MGHPRGVSLPSRSPPGPVPAHPRADLTPRLPAERWHRWMRSSLSPRPSPPPMFFTAAAAIFPAPQHRGGGTAAPPPMGAPAVPTLANGIARRARTRQWERPPRGALGGQRRAEGPRSGAGSAAMPDRDSEFGDRGHRTRDTGTRGTPGHPRGRDTWPARGLSCRSGRGGSGPVGGGRRRPNLRWGSGGTPGDPWPGAGHSSAGGRGAATACGAAGGDLGGWGPAVAQGRGATRGCGGADPQRGD